MPTSVRGNSPGLVAEGRHLQKDNCTPFFGYQTVETMHLKKLKFPKVLDWKKEKTVTLVPTRRGACPLEIEF